MANYIGLKGVFDALAGGGANAVNIYAQEKDRQRRLAFDERKLKADRDYRKQVLDQDQQRINLAVRKQDQVENAWQHLQDQDRRKNLVDLQYRIVGNARARAMEKGFDNPLLAAKSGDEEALGYFNSGIQNVARYTLNREVDTQLIPSGKDSAGDTLYSVVYTEGGNQKNFGQPATMDEIAGKLSGFNQEIGIPVILADSKIKVDSDKSGKPILVNGGDGGPELTPDQKQKVDQLDQQLKEGTGEGLQQRLENPVLPQLQSALGKSSGGVAYEGMPSEERYRKPQNLKAFYEEQSKVADALDGVKLSDNPHVEAYNNAGGGLSGAAAFAGSAVGERIKTYKDAYGSVKKGLGYVADLAGTAVEAGKASANGEVLPKVEAEQAEQPASEQNVGSTEPPPTKAPRVRPEVVHKQIVDAKTSGNRKAAIFANQVMASGGRDAMSSAAMQTIYQALRNGDADASAAASSKLTAGNIGSKKEVDAYAKFFDTIRDQVEPHVENHARLLLEGNEGQEGHEQKVKLHQSGITDTLYAMSTQFKNMGYDISKLSRHPETYRDMVAVSAKYYDAKRGAIKHNENLGWFGTKRELPNMTNYMLKTITQTAPKTAERMALSMAFGQNPEADSGTIAKEAQSLLKQWQALDTFMDEPAE